MQTTRQLNTMIPNELYQRLQDAAVALGIGPAGIVTSALRSWLGRLERRNGGPFPSRGDRRVKQGRPRKSTGKRAG